MSTAAPTPTILVNGRTAREVSALDRGFTLGDGLFETIAVRGGRVRCWNEHCERLAEGCRRLDLPAPDAESLHDELQRCRGGEPDGTVRITLSRGEGSRGYAIPRHVVPTRVVAWFPGLPAFPQRPLNLRVCHTRLAANPALAGLKHLNRLEQVLARAEWDDPQIDEGVMLDIDGAVIECTSSNLFIVTGAGLRTPDLSRCGVAGVVRRCVVELAAGLDLPLEIGRLSLDDIRTADELFVTNASRGIAPVGHLDDRHWATAPGPRTLQLQRALEEAGR